MVHVEFDRMRIVRGFELNDSQFTHTEFNQDFDTKLTFLALNFSLGRVF